MYVYFSRRVLVLINKPIFVHRGEVLYLDEQDFFLVLSQ